MPFSFKSWLLTSLLVVLFLSTTGCFKNNDDSTTSSGEGTALEVGDQVSTVPASE